jgi:hypothetical protein
VRQENVDAIVGRAAFKELRQDTQRLEGAQRGAAKADAGAVRTPARIDFDHVDVQRLLAQLDGGSHAGKAAANDEDFFAGEVMFVSDDDVLFMPACRHREERGQRGSHGVCLIGLCAPAGAEDAVWRRRAGSRAASWSVVPGSGPDAVRPATFGCANRP